MPSISQVISALTYLPQIGQAQATFDANVNGHIGTELPQLISQINTWAGQANALAAAINAALTPSALSISYGFNTGIAGDPGAGKLLFNNATIASVTQINLDVLDSAGNNVAAAIDLFDNSTSSVKGYLKVEVPTDPNKFAVFSVDGAVGTPGGYCTVPVTFRLGAGTFSGTDSLVVEFTPTGDKGDQGATGSVALTGTATGTVKLLNATSVASAATVNLDSTTDGNLRHVTGTTTITAVTLTRGPMWVIFDGVLTLTHHATNNNLPGAANITTAAGDRALYWNDGTTTYCLGFWKADGTAVISGNAAFGALGTANVIASVNAGTNPVAICSLTATRQMKVYKDASSQPTVAIVDASGAVLVAATTVEAVATTSTSWQIYPLTSTTAIFCYGTASATRAVILTDATSSITIGTIQTVEATSSAMQCFIPFSATKVGVAYQTTVVKGCVLSIAGTAITVNTPSTLSATNHNGDLRADAISSTQGVVVAATTASGPGPYAFVVTESALSMTPGVERLVLRVQTSNGNVALDVCAVSSTRVAVAAASADVTGAALFLDVGGTGGTAYTQNGRAILLPSVGATKRVRLKKYSSKTLLLQQGDSENNAHTLTTLTINGDAINLGSAAASVARSGGGAHDFCIPVGGSTIVSAYLDGKNSNFPTARSVALGTVV